MSAFEFGLPVDSAARAVMLLEGEGVRQRVTMTVHTDSDGAVVLTVGGAARLMVEGVDVRERWQICEGLI